MNQKVAVCVSFLFVLFNQTSIFSQSLFNDTTLSNTQIAQQLDSNSSINGSAPKKRRSAGPRFIDLPTQDASDQNENIYNRDQLNNVKQSVILLRNLLFNILLISLWTLLDLDCLASILFLGKFLTVKLRDRASTIGNFKKPYFLRSRFIQNTTH